MDFHTRNVENEKTVFDNVCFDFKGASNTHGGCGHCADFSGLSGIRREIPAIGGCLDTE